MSKLSSKQKKYFHELMRNPKIIALCKKYPLFWYSHLFLGMSWINPATKKPYDYENLSNADAIKLKHYHFKWSLLPEYKNHKWDGTKDPLYEMWLCVRNHDWAGASAATSVGKTWSLSIFALYYLTVFQGSQIVCVGVSFTSLLLSIWAEVKNKWAKEGDPKYGVKKLLPDAVMLDSGVIICDKADLQNSKWKMYLRAIKNEGEDTKSSAGLQGIHSQYLLILADETPKLAQSTINAAEQTLTGDHNTLLCVGNPDSKLDPLARTMAKKRVKAIRISSLDFPNYVCGREVIPGGSVSRKSVIMRREDLGEENHLYQSRVRGMFPATNKNSLLKAEDFYACVRSATEEERADRRVSLGLDISSSEDGDKAAYSFFEGNVLMYLPEFTCSNAGALPANLLKTGEDLVEYLTISPETGQPRSQELPNMNLPYLPDFDITDEDIAVDAVGLGESTVNAFQNQFDWFVYTFYGGSSVKDDLERLVPLDAEEKPMFKFANVRTLAFFLLLYAIRKKEIVINADTISKDDIDEIYAELGAMQLEQTGGASGLRLENKRLTKKRIGKSPNKADALYMGNFIREFNNVIGSSGLYR